jgi:pilus assembly protein CpaB
MTRRILAIMIAIVFAAVGTAGVLFYALSADQRARSNIDGVTVAVADKRIPVGTSGARIRAENLIRLERLPKGSVPSDALPDVSAELDKLVVTSSIAPGQVLMLAMFGEQSKVTSGLNLPDGTMAVTVETGAPEQVAGYVRPGSRIAVFLTYNMLDEELKETKVQRTRVLLANVEVLTVGTYQPGRAANGASDTGTTSNTSSSNGSLLVTVAVTQAEAERLIEGLHTGKLYLGLLTDAIEVTPGTGVENTDSGGGISPLFK